MEDVKRDKPLLKRVLQALKPHEVIEDNFRIKEIILSMMELNEFTINELIENLKNRRATYKKYS